jgi:predicted deacylase
MSEKKFVLFGQEIKRGKSASIDVEVAKLHTHNSLYLRVIVARGKEEGPVLLLIGGVHGDETNGVAIVREVIRHRYNRPQRGTVICIPVFNVFGYLNKRREFPDGRDLNRMFPGKARGSLASQFAYTFSKEIAPLADYILDFHTGGAERQNYPNVRCVLEEENSFALAKAFGAPFIVQSKHIAKSLRETVHRMGKNVLLFEGGKSLALDDFVIDCGVQGTLNIMRYLAMRDGQTTAATDSIIINKSKWLRAPNSGLFQALVNNGSRVSARTVIGRIADPYGEFERKIRTPIDGYIFGLNNSPIVHKGDAIFHIGVESNHSLASS